MSNNELNSLNINGFIFEVARIPILKYSVQEVNFPGATLPEAIQPTPFINVSVPGDHVDMDELSFTFIVDEQMQNYRALYLWIQGLAFPDRFDQFVDFIKGVTDPNMATFSSSERLNQYSDVTVTILTNHKNPQFKYRFIDAHPINLSGFSAQVTNSTSEPIVATCTMKFTGMQIESV